MTKAETKRDIHHLYGHWPERTAVEDSNVKALLFYQWLESMDTGILNFGEFGDGAVVQHIAAWVQEWEGHRGLRVTQH
jgi:hypothetical protein